MILDSGICTVFRKETVTNPGAMPTFDFVKVCSSWYKRTTFGTVARTLGGVKESRDVDLKIRVLQDLNITNHCCVVLSECDTMPSFGSTVYEVLQAYHDKDQDNGALITDLYLGVYEP